MALIRVFWLREHLSRVGETVLRLFPGARCQNSGLGHFLVGIVGLLVRDPGVMRDQSAIRARSERGTANKCDRSSRKVTTKYV